MGPVFLSRNGAGTESNRERGQGDSFDEANESLSRNRAGTDGQQGNPFDEANESADVVGSNAARGQLVTEDF